jgi:uncharacterized protein YodC (DUF2158 family)
VRESSLCHPDDISPGNDIPAMEHEEFKIGDRVRGKGVYGPDMIVQEVYAPVFKYRYRCVWQDAQGMPAHELFRPEQLERVPGPA